MALKRLSTAEMVQISGPWVTNGTPARKGLQAFPECVGILPRVEEAHKQLHGARPGQGDARAAEISAEAAEVDARHDAVVRGVDFVLEGIALLLGEGGRAREIDAARWLLTPEGISVVSTSYRNEAGAAALLASRLGRAPDVKKLRASIVVDKKTTLASFVNERIALGERLGVLEDEASSLPRPSAGRAASSWRSEASFSSRPPRMRRARTSPPSAWLRLLRRATGTSSSSPEG